MYNPLCSYLYDQAVSFYKGPKSPENINIYDDIVVPTLLILDGLRYEFNCTTTVISKEVIALFESKGFISQTVADAFSFIINSVGKIRWSMHSIDKNVQDTVKLDKKIKL